MKGSSRDGGRLFWEDFEKRVIGKITKEHEEIKRARNKSDFYEQLYRKQRHVMIAAYNDDENHERLTMCESCKDFFLFEEDEDFECECGNRLCGKHDEDGDCCVPIDCDKCDKSMFFCCSTHCEECEQVFCTTCVPTSEDFDVHSGNEFGQIWTFCSAKCKSTYLENNTIIN